MYREYEKRGKKKERSVKLLSILLPCLAMLVPLSTVLKGTMHSDVFLFIYKQITGATLFYM